MGKSESKPSEFRLDFSFPHRRSQLISNKCLKNYLAINRRHSKLRKQMRTTYGKTRSHSQSLLARKRNPAFLKALHPITKCLLLRPIFKTSLIPQSSLKVIREYQCPMSNRFLLSSLIGMKILSLVEKSFSATWVSNNKNLLRILHSHHRALSLPNLTKPMTTAWISSPTLSNRIKPNQPRSKPHLFS